MTVNTPVWRDTDVASAAPEHVSGGTLATKRHGDVVIDAISWPTRMLMAGVILVNLTLGAWLVKRADFSTVKPQGVEGAAPAGAPAERFRFEDDVPLVVAPSLDNRGVLALNERD